METLKSKEFNREDEKNFIIDKFLFLAREQEQTEKEMIELCCKIISEHDICMEDAIDERKQLKAFSEFVNNSSYPGLEEMVVTD